MTTLQEIQQHPDIQALIAASNRYLAAIGYTEHGQRHVSYVSRTAAFVLTELGFDDDQVQLAAIAGWVHDVGNSINRKDHGANGAVLLFPLLLKMDMPIENALEIVTAVGNHEEQSGAVISAVSAALVIGDKSDAHRTRVRNQTPTPGDIHDRVNFAIRKNRVLVDREKHVIRHTLEMDTTSSVMEYLQIYLQRIVMCEQAAAFLKCSFDLVINGRSINNRPQI